MQLLYTKRSPYARKARIMAIEKNIPLECIEEDLVNKSSRLKESNPLGRIPTLILDDGELICDSPLICEYLENLKDKPAFIPKDEKARRHILNLAAIADGLMEDVVGIYLEKTRHPQDFHQGFVHNKEDACRRSFTFFENHVADLKNFNIASIGVVSAVGYMHFRLPNMYETKKYPALTRWFDECQTRPSVAQTVPVL